MQKYRYYLPPQSKLPFAAGILSGLLCLDNIYTLISMPHYTQYWDYWATLAAALLLCVFCFLFRQRRTELTLIPAAILALIACITPNLVHWLEVGMFFLLLLLWLLRLPKWVGTLCRLAGIVLTVIGSGAILAPMAERISMLSRTGRATAEFVVPFVIRSLGGDLLILLTFLLLIFRYASSCAAPLDRRKRPVRPHLGMTDIPIKKQKPYLRHSLPRVRFFYC